MREKTEQMYLGDLISADAKHDKNVMSRKNKSIGIIDQIMDILNSTYFGKYFFEVALVLRSSLLLSSILLNSEAWVNLTHGNIRSLEQIDEKLLSRILESEANTSNAMKYMELGLYPIRFEIMKRKIIFLQYILKQDKESIMFKVFKATCENPIKNDFVEKCKKYLQQLNIKMSFEEIGQMSNMKFKNIVKQKTEEAGFKYLLIEKNKQTKIADLNYENLEMQEYLNDGNRNTRISKLIFKARGRNLNIKMHKKWKYSDAICVGAEKNYETENELLLCAGLGDRNENEELTYSWLFDSSVTKMVKVAIEIEKRLKRRKVLLEEEPG